MIEFFREFLASKSAFERIVRAVLFGAAAAMATGQVPVPAEYAWIPAVLAGLVAAGEKNR